MPYILTIDSGLRITDLNLCVQISTNETRMFLDNSFPFAAWKLLHQPLVIQHHETAVILKKMLEEHADEITILSVEEQSFEDATNIKTIPTHIENLILTQGKTQYATR